jgi:hypothetical protein
MHDLILAYIRLLSLCLYKSGVTTAEGLLPRARGRAGPAVTTLTARGDTGPLPGGKGGPDPRGQSG